MRSFHLAALLSVLFVFAGLAATKAKPAAKKKSTKAVATSKNKAAKGKKAPSTPAATWRTRQQAPSSDRYKEIQQALVTKGYLKSEPSGAWDADSTNAMARFQADQKMTPTGKINAPSLIGLGLGAKSAGAPEAAPLPGSPPPVIPTASPVTPTGAPPEAPAASQ